VAESCTVCSFRSRRPETSGYAIIFQIWPFDC